MLIPQCLRGSARPHGRLRWSARGGRRLRDDAHQHRLKFRRTVCRLRRGAGALWTPSIRRREAFAHSGGSGGPSARRCIPRTAGSGAADTPSFAIRARRRCIYVTADLNTTIASIRGEYLASRSVALGCAGRIDECLSLADEASSATRGIEARVLSEAARVIAAIRGRRGDVRSACERLLDVLEDSNGTDLLVSAYRSSPDLLAVLLKSRDLRDRLAAVLRRVGDEHLLGAATVATASDKEPATLLSPREFEVYELICRGLTNRQIATYLFISEATVKVHAHHIFDKLGNQIPARARARRRPTTRWSGDRRDLRNRRRLGIWF